MDKQKSKNEKQNLVPCTKKYNRANDSEDEEGAGRQHDRWSWAEGVNAGSLTAEELSSQPVKASLFESTVTC